MFSVTCKKNHLHYGQYGAAGVLIYRYRKDGEVEFLLGLRALSSKSPYTWANFGGIIDREDETPQQAALREVEEEIGIKASDLRPMGYSQNDHGGWVYTLYFATPTRNIPDSDIRIDEREHMMVRWFTRKDYETRSPKWGDSGILREFERLTLSNLNFILPPNVDPTTMTIKED